MSKKSNLDDIIQILYNAQSGHSGPSLSIVEILVFLFFSKKYTGGVVPILFLPRKTPKPFFFIISFGDEGFKPMASRLSFAFDRLEQQRSDRDSLEKGQQRFGGMSGNHKRKKERKEEKRII